MGHGDELWPDHRVGRSPRGGCSAARFLNHGEITGAIFSSGCVGSRRGQITGRNPPDVCAGEASAGIGAELRTEKTADNGSGRLAFGFGLRRSERRLTEPSHSCSSRYSQLYDPVNTNRARKNQSAGDSH